MITEKTIGNIINGETSGTLNNVVLMCLAAHLPWDMSDYLIQRSGHQFRRRETLLHIPAQIPQSSVEPPLQPPLEKGLFGTEIAHTTDTAQVETGGSGGLLYFTGLQHIDHLRQK